MLPRMVVLGIDPGLANLGLGLIEGDARRAKHLYHVCLTTESAWFAARPSGTEDVYKIYAESFLGADHLAQVQAEAKKLVDSVIA